MATALGDRWEHSLKWPYSLTIDLTRGSLKSCLSRREAGQLFSLIEVWLEASLVPPSAPSPGEHKLPVSHPTLWRVCPASWPPRGSCHSTVSDESGIDFLCFAQYHLYWCDRQFISSVKLIRSRNPLETIWGHV